MHLVDKATEMLMPGVHTYPNANLTKFQASAETLSDNECFV